MLKSPMIEASVRALAAINERNGGPPYDAYDLIYGEKRANEMRGELLEQVEAVIMVASTFLVKP